MIDKNEKLKKSNVSNEIFDLVGISKKNSYSILAGGPRFSGYTRSSASLVNW